MRGMHEMGEHGPMGGWDPFDFFEMMGSVIGLVLLVGLLVLIVWGASRYLSVQRPVGQVDSAENILRKRFARGEIASEEYERSLEVLRENPPPVTPQWRRYEDYVREAMWRLSSGRRTNL
jgi:putative membrane protein